MELLLTCIPVLSTLKAKFPLPTCKAVVLLSMRLDRMTLNWDNMLCLGRSLALTRTGVDKTYLSMWLSPRVGSKRNAQTILMTAIVEKKSSLYKL
jgi:hypothetical protein